MRDIKPSSLDIRDLTHRAKTLERVTRITHFVHPIDLGKVVVATDVDVPVPPIWITQVVKGVALVYDAVVAHIAMVYRYFLAMSEDEDVIVLTQPRSDAAE